MMAIPGPNLAHAKRAYLAPLKAVIVTPIGAGLTQAGRSPYRNGRKSGKTSVETISYILERACRGTFILGRRVLKPMSRAMRGAR